MKWGIRRFQPYSTTGPRKGGKTGKEVGLAKNKGNVISRVIHKITTPLKADIKSIGQRIADSTRQKGIADKASSLVGYRASRITAKNREDAYKQLASEAFTEYGKFRYNTAAKNEKHEQNFSSAMLKQKRTPKTVILGRTMWNKTYRNKRVATLDGKTRTEGEMFFLRSLSRDVVVSEIDRRTQHGGRRNN